MIAFKALSALLAYPTEALLDALPEIAAILEQPDGLGTQQRKALRGLIDELATSDPIDLQERYVALFDRGRATSLHLFEHVHGESRERGTAMVDLKQVYARAGLQLRGGELPDYLPALLEFMSLRPRAESIEMLQDCAHILRSVGDALYARDSGYSAVFATLLALCGEAGLTKAQSIEPALADEDLDKEWTDEPVIFGPAAACGEAKAQVAPVRFHPRERSTPASIPSPLGGEG
jgi:nitrate reductase molybdenum cofactor assembly chaperone NarJ/NarW